MGALLCTPPSLRLREEPWMLGEDPGAGAASLAPHSPPHRLSDSAFDSLRLWVLVALCLLRLAVTRPHLQAYLCLAKARVEQLRREAGRIEAREIQRRVWAPKVGRELGAQGRGLKGVTRSPEGCPAHPSHVATATCPLGGASLLLRDGGESAVPDAAHLHPQLHPAAQDTG